MATVKILVVDDEKIIRNALERELESAGFEVDSALSGEAALEMVKKKKYDIIFLDMSMPPGIDGIQTCRAIKEIDPDPTAIFMTGTLDEQLVIKEAKFIQEGGEVYFFYKPFAKGEILEVVNKALAKRGNRETEKPKN